MVPEASVHIEIIHLSVPKTTFACTWQSVSFLVLLCGASYD